MHSSDRKRKSEKPVANGNKRLRSSPSVVLHSYSKLPTVNDTPERKTQPLDLFVWGTGSMSELGLGPAASTKEVKRPRLNPYLTKEALGGENIVDFAVGGMHTLAVDTKNRVWSWGSNDNGVLGRDTSHAKEAVKDIEEESEDEDADLNEAESTPNLVENLPSNGHNIIQLAATDNLSAVLYDNGDVYAWGCFRNNEGLLGFLKDKIKLQKTPLKIDQLKNIVQLAGGKDHLLALDSKGVVYGWGNSQQFQLGRKVLDRHRYRELEPKPFGLYGIKYIASGDYHCYAISHDDEVYVWGLNQYGQCAITGSQGELEDGSLITKPTLLLQLKGKKVIQLAAGEHHSLALLENGEVYAWGRYDMKEVGIPESSLPEDTYRDSHSKPRSVPTPTKLQFVSKSGNTKCKYVGCGSHHSFAITDDGMVYAWGFADTYATGLGPLDSDVERPTRIVNTATKFHDIHIVGGGGQFSVSGGVKIEDHSEGEKRLKKYDD